MTSGQLLLEGLELMLIGMSLVFVFLILLIGCIHLISVVLQRATVHESVALVATPVTCWPCARCRHPCCHPGRAAPASRPPRTIIRKIWSPTDDR
jgi:hypothetical protein